MGYIGIDTKAFQDEIDKIKDIKDDFINLSDILERDTNSLKEYWQTDTSEGVYNDFDKYYVKLENVINTLNNDIEFLEKTAKQGYIKEDKGTNNLVDTKIAETGR